MAGIILRMAEIDPGYGGYSIGKVEGYGGNQFWLEVSTKGRPVHP